MSLYGAGNTLECVNRCGLLGNKTAMVLSIIIITKSIMSIIKNILYWKDEGKVDGEVEKPDGKSKDKSLWRQVDFYFSIGTGAVGVIFLILSIVLAARRSTSGQHD
jgi:hypothetical protein